MPDRLLLIPAGAAALTVAATCGFVLTLRFTPDDRPMREVLVFDALTLVENRATPVPIRPSTAFLQRDSSIDHSPDGCGNGTLLALENGDALGRQYSDADRLVVLVRYSAPNCQQAGARFFGYHESGSPWYDYWCHDDCADRFGSSFFANGLAPLPGDEGLIEIPAVPGRHPPPDASAAPSLEGFTLCAVEVNFSDGRFGGTYYTRTFAYRC